MLLLCGEHHVRELDIVLEVSPHVGVVDVCFDSRE